MQGSAGLGKFGLRVEGRDLLARLGNPEPYRPTWCQSQRTAQDDLPREKLTVPIRKTLSELRLQLWPLMRDQFKRMRDARSRQGARSWLPHVLNGDQPNILRTPVGTQALVLRQPPNSPSAYATGMYKSEERRVG